MSVFRHTSSVGRRSSHMPLLAVAFVAGQLAWSPVHAAEFGHSRLVSAVGEPLRITIPVTQISGAEIDSLRIDPAPASAWTNAGLTPPVDLATLQARLADGYAPGSRVIQVWSDHVFNQPIADLLLDIRTSSGVQRYQVSLLARGGAMAVQAPSAQADSATGRSDVMASSEQGVDQKPILVRRGDTMFAVAGRHAVSGVSVYQMMIALQRASPHAFIHDNINLVKAGEQLAMPDMAALTAISDREARRLFHEQVVAFNAYRQGSGDHLAGDPAAQSLVRTGSEASPVNSVSNVPQSRIAAGDQLRLSSGRTANASAAGSGGAAADQSLTDAQQHTGTVNNLAQNMASGVSNTAHAAMTDAELAAMPGSASDSAPAAGAAPATDSASSTGSAEAADSKASGASAQGDGVAATDNDSAADDAVAARKAISDAEQRVSQLEENVKNLNRALQSQGEAAKDLVVDGAIGLRQSLTDVATAVTDATIGDEEFLETPSDSGQTDTASTTGVVPETQQDNATASTMESITTWLHTNLIGVITGLLALVVLVIAWALRRANITQSRTDSAVTPEMVKEKLEQINLDLNEPTIGESPSSRS